MPRPPMPTAARAPRSPARAGQLSVPRGAVDTHVHLLDPARFPFDPATPYRPQSHECGTTADLVRVLDANGFARVVLVAPTSGYGFDLRCLLAGLDELGGRARGIARVPLACDAPTLRALAARGVAGVRLDLVADGIDSGKLPAIAGLLRRLADADLLLDVQCEGDQLALLAPLLHAIPVRIVVDHLGRPVPARGVRQPGFAALRALAATGRAAVKLSGAMRCSAEAPPHRDVDRFVAALARDFGPERLVWGSDWPFLRSPRRVDYAPLIADLARWFPDAAARRRILATTPVVWFGFPRR